jgi:hypothetical protein
LAAGAGALLFGVLQLLPAPPRTNPPVSPGRRIESVLDVPPQVSGLIHRVCGNCHSNETRWPWYSHVAPFSWLVGSDVARARSAMNFSDWPSLAEGIPGAGAAKLAAACAVLSFDIMPPPRYRFLHPEARPSAAEKQAFCAWTKALVPTTPR